MNEQHDRSIRTSIGKMAGTFGRKHVTLITGEVLSIDSDNRQCTVLIENDTELTCQLMATVGDGILPIPSIGSTVAVIYATYEDAYVIMCSDIDSLSFKGSENGGLVKVIDLVTKLNAIENDVNKLRQAFTTWTPVPNDGGAALKIAALNWASNLLNLTQQSDLENTSITHGS